MEMDKMASLIVKASEARRFMQQFLLRDLNYTIEKESKAGNSFFFTTLPEDEEIKNVLKSAGYKVEKKDTKPNEYIISWL